MELRRIIVINHVAFFTICAKLTMAFTFTSLRVFELFKIREHFEMHLIMNTKRIKLRRFEVILTPLSS